MKLPQLYTSWAHWWPLISDPADYAEEADFYRARLVEACEGEARTLLELGSGGGNNASHLKAHFDLTLVDRSAAMLEESKALNPECLHLFGDMRTLQLDRQFDCVFIHDAIVYMTTAADLAQALATAARHCRPGGALLVAPDHTKENFQSTTGHGGADGDTRAARYLQWSWDPDPADDTYITQFALLLRGTDGSVRVAHEEHQCGLFSRATWLRLCEDAGFTPTAVPFEHSEIEAGTCEIFIGRRHSH